MNVRRGGTLAEDEAAGAAGGGGAAQAPGWRGGGGDRRFEVGQPLLNPRRRSRLSLTTQYLL